MKKIYTLTKTIKSNSHNSNFTMELGNHWPAGQKFTLCPSRMQTYFNKVLFEQVGGEEVLLLVPDTQVEELFGITR